MVKLPCQADDYVTKTYNHIKFKFIKTKIKEKYTECRKYCRSTRTCCCRTTLHKIIKNDNLEKYFFYKNTRQRTNSQALGLGNVERICSGIKLKTNELI